MNLVAEKQLSLLTKADSGSKSESEVAVFIFVMSTTKMRNHGVVL